jgi:hypothetical protein
MGAVVPFLAKHIWKVTIEPKCKFFAWLVLHNRAITADNMAKKNWDCDPFCPLYFCMQETTSHILIHYNNVECHCWPLQPADVQSHEQFQNSCSMGLFHVAGWGSQFKMQKARHPFLFLWQIWKERNRRIFEGKECSVNQVAAIIQEELSAHNLAQSFATAADLI